MTYVDDLLDQVRAKIEARPRALDEARSRLQLVRDAATSFPGSLRTYRSGSLAVHTMNDPVTDGDGGLVLNRVHYPMLGPDGGGEAPEQVVEDLIDHIRPRVRDVYPAATINRSKRGPKIFFGEPIDGADPTVDLVVAMNRREAKGLWIPNLELDRWEPSDPEGHVALLNGGLPAFRSTRRKVTRLAKAWNKQFEVPGASSFQMSVWALEFVEPGQGTAKGLAALFGMAAARLEAGIPTKDPAGVSANLRLLIDTERMAKRLRRAADHMSVVLASHDKSEVRDAISIVFHRYIDSESTSALKNAVALLKTNRPVSAAALNVPLVATTGAAYRAYGGYR